MVKFDLLESHCGGNSIVSLFSGNQCVICEWKNDSDMGQTMP